jgi:GNAT superfamily N-acetyltransferase
MHEIRSDTARIVRSATETTAPLTRLRDRAISVRRARLSDYPQIAAFIREAYQEQSLFKAKGRWDWQFVNDPYIKSDDGEVPVWIAEDSGRVIGQIAVQEGEIQIDGVTYSAGWIVDVMILPSYRGLGLGHRLYAEVAKECLILVTLTMAPATRRIAEGLGAVNLGEVRLYSRGTNLENRTVKRYLLSRTAYHPRLNLIVRVLCKYFFADRMVAWAGNLLLSFRNTLFQIPDTRKETRIVETDKFGSELDLLWQQVSPDFPIAFSRKSKFMNWRFSECPQMKYRLFTASRHGNVVGYMVLRRKEPIELPQGVIVDLLAARKDRETIEDLVAFALEHFGNDVATVECATSIPEFAVTLRRFGFYSVRTERPNGVVAESGIRRRLEDSSTDWLFSKADHDWDQINPA